MGGGWISDEIVVISEGVLLSFLPEEWRAFDDLRREACRARENVSDLSPWLDWEGLTEACYGNSFEDHQLDSFEDQLDNHFSWVDEEAEWAEETKEKLRAAYKALQTAFEQRTRTDRHGLTLHLGGHPGGDYEDDDNEAPRVFWHVKNYWVVSPAGALFGPTLQLEIKAYKRYVD
jgi:hypothetical protein